MNNNNTPTQSKFKSNNDRAKFKQECIGALAGIAAKYNVKIEFGPITEHYPFEVNEHKHGHAVTKLHILEQ
jgi:hypothetical protein